VKLRSWPEIGSEGNVLLAPYVPKGITGDDDDETDDVKYLGIYPDRKLTLLNHISAKRKQLDAKYTESMDENPSYH
jgi:hypothetical protein